MDSLQNSFSSTRREEFYSDEVYQPHPLSEEFPLMNSEQVTELGKNILKLTQLDAIDIYEGKILDGRNRYYACKEFSITPRFRKLPEEFYAEEYVYSKNLQRRHLTPAQRAELALKLVQIEKRKARKRQLSNLKQFQNKKVTDRPSGGLTVTSGKAIDIVAKREHISRKSLYTAQKVKRINDLEINEKWEDAKKGEATIKSVDKVIRERYPSPKSKAKKKKNSDDELQDKDSTKKSKEEINQFVSKIRENTIRKFIESGKKSLDKTTDNNNYCKLCGKASVMAVECESCGYMTPKVICDDDLIKGEARLRNPYRIKCEKSVD